MANKSSINELCKYFCTSTKEIVEANTNSTISFSPTIQKIPATFLKPDVGSFVEFYGDFSGLVIINFSKEAAIEIYRNYMTNLGIPEEELTDNYNSNEVSDSLGEIINQIGGKVRKEIENNFNLSVKNNQPKVITISNTILISISSDINKPYCRRISFKTAGQKSFYIEIAIEQIDFISLFENENTKDNSSPNDIYDLDVESIIASIK